MKIQDIQDEKGREECLGCSLGMLVLPPLEFVVLNKDSFRKINIGPAPVLSIPELTKR